MCDGEESARGEPALEMNARICIDTGGSYSDFVLIDEESGAIRTAKVPSTPSDPPRAIHAGLVQLGAVDFQHIVIGTTVATNAVVQRRGPEAAPRDYGWEDGT